MQAGAAAACLGALLALITGVGRTAMAMARERDLPSPLARVGGRHTVPFVAELSVAAAVIVLLLTTDVLTVVGFSSFGVLIYYAVTNAAAFTLAERPGQRAQMAECGGLRWLPGSCRHAAVCFGGGHGGRAGRRSCRPVPWCCGSGSRRLGLEDADVQVLVRRRPAGGIGV